MSRGRYLDSWRCRDGRWLITRRTYVSDLTTTQPVIHRDLSDQLPRAAGLTPITPAQDLIDPSYAHMLATATSAAG